VLSFEKLELVHREHWSRRRRKPCETSSGADCPWQQATHPATLVVGLTHNPQGLSCFLNIAILSFGHAEA
jgi:hypothetical protein